MYRTHQKSPAKRQQVIYLTSTEDGTTQEVIETVMEPGGFIYEEEVKQEGGELEEIDATHEVHNIQIVETQPTDEEAIQIATQMSGEDLGDGNTEYVIITVPQDTPIDSTRMVYDIQAAVQSILK